MRLLTKVAAGSAATIGAGAAGVFFYRRSSQAAANAADKPKELTAKEFNALQDAAFLRGALQPQHLPWTFHTEKQRHPGVRESLTQVASPSCDAAQPSLYTPSAADVKILFYRLLGCPYCAKVEAMLQFSDVPYAEIWVDPITGAGLPDERYSLAPQLYLTPLATGTTTTTTSGAFLVDSAAIAMALAAPLRYTADLANPHTSATRDWITNHFHGASFAITNSTFRNSYSTYPYVTPDRYQNFFYHVVGSGALSLLSRLKIQPKLVAKMEAHEADAPQGLDSAATAPSTGLWMLSEEVRKSLAATMRGGSADEWLRAELAVFLARRPAGAIFHGGAAPDLADVEMYGVSRVVDQHPRLGPVLREGDFGEWQVAMQTRLKETTGAVYA